MPSQSEECIRKMDASDIGNVTAAHLASFQNFFLSFLGPRFLNLYYAGICRDPRGISYVHVVNNQIVGFIVGASDPRGFYSSMLKRDWLRFGLASISAIVRKPLIVRRIARAFFHPSGNPIGDGVAGLFSIGVLQTSQGLGIGKKLVQEFLVEAKRRGCTKVFLTTDCDGNEGVNKFYQTLGFKIERQFQTPEGRRMNEYWMELS